LEVMIAVVAFDDKDDPEACSPASALLATKSYS